MRSKKIVRFKNSMKNDVKRLSGSLTHKSLTKEPSLKKLHASPSQIEEGLPHRYKSGGSACNKGRYEAFLKESRH